MPYRRDFIGAESQADFHADFYKNANVRLSSGSILFGGGVGFCISLLLHQMMVIPDGKKRRFISSKFIKTPLQCSYIYRRGHFCEYGHSGIGGYFRCLYLDGRYTMGAIVFVALVLDSVDGRVARATNTFSSFGAKLDAIADKTRSIFVAACFYFVGAAVSHHCCTIYLLSGDRTFKGDDLA